VLARVVAELVRDHDLLLAQRKRLGEQRVPEHHAPRGPDPEREGVGLVGVRAHFLDPQRYAWKPLLALKAPRGQDECLLAERLRAVVEVGRDEGEEGGDGNEGTGSRQPPVVAEPAREGHDDEQRQADREELGGKHRPVLEQPGEVVEIADVVTPVPPVRHEPEREPDEPDDGEAEHAEEHPGADRARGRLAGESGSAPGVQPQHGDEGDLRERPDDEEKALVAMRVRDELGSEHLVDVDTAEGEVVGNSAGKKEHCAEREEASDYGRDHGAHEPAVAIRRRVRFQACQRRVA
jgi:hypothetical protein